LPHSYLKTFFVSFSRQILYAPELLRAEFKSEVADMKNSVKDRGNAQASCAVRMHRKWLHSFLNFFDRARRRVNGQCSFSRVLFFRNGC
jgi:hypothetical protein